MKYQTNYQEPFLKKTKEEVIRERLERGIQHDEDVLNRMQSISDTARYIIELTKRDKEVKERELQKFL